MAARSRTVQFSSILGVSAIIFLLDWFYLIYANSHGLGPLQTPSVVGMSFPIPIQWLPLTGVVVLSLVTWYEAYYRVFPRRGSIDPMGRIRLIRAIVFSTALFVVVLYVPLLLGSNWFWSSVSAIGKSVTQIRDFGNFMLNSFGSLIGLEMIWAYAIAQVLASGALVLGAFAFARAARRVRK
jgi:hypothetical protein